MTTSTRYVVEYRDNGMKCGESFTILQEALFDHDRRVKQGKANVRILRETLTTEDITYSWREPGEGC